MNVREIVQIDEDTCTGCGLCADVCAEGAIEIIDGKAKLITDSYCDGLGACLGDCPEDAIRIIKREADAFDEEAVEKHLAAKSTPAPAPTGCPGMAVMNFTATDEPAPGTAVPGTAGASELRQWPIQLHLVPPNAPYWQDADLLICADCVPASYADYQQHLLRGRRLIIACPKLDETSGYVGKLTAILAHNSIRSVTVAHMEVPCCTGILRMAEAALAASGKDIPFEDVVIGINGEHLP